MRLFLEILWVKKCSKLKSGGGVFPMTLHIFPMPKIWICFFCSSAFVEKIIRGNIIHDSFYQLVLNMRKYLPKKALVNGPSPFSANACIHGTRYFRGPFPFSANACIHGTRYFRGPFPFSANACIHGTRYFRGPFPFSANIYDTLYFRGPFSFSANISLY